MKLGFGLGLRGVGGGGAPVPPGLQAYWHLDEESGVRVDATGHGYDLTDNNTVGFATGKIGGCARTVAGSSESLSRAVPAGFLVGKSYSVTFWCRYRGGATPGDMAIPVDLAVNAGGYESGPSFRWYDGYGGLYVYGHGGLGAQVVPGSGDLSTIVDVWKFIAMAYDATAQQAWCCCDSGADISASGVAPIAATGFPAPVVVGNSMRDVSWDVDEVSLWFRALSRAERLDIYNAGAGKVLL